MAEHRVRLAQRIDLRELGIQRRLARRVDAERVEAGALLEHLAVLLRVGQELVQRRIQQAHGDGQPVHRAEDPDEILALEGQELVERDLLRERIGRHDHVAHDGNPLGGEEHVLGPHEADALGAEAPGPRGVFRRVGIGPHAELAIAVGPPEKLLRRSADLRRGALDRVEDHLTRLTIDRDDVALADHAPTGLEHPALLVDHDVVGADDARFAHADRDHRRV